MQKSLSTKFQAREYARVGDSIQRSLLSLSPLSDRR